MFYSSPIDSGNAFLSPQSELSGDDVDLVRTDKGQSGFRIAREHDMKRLAATLISTTENKTLFHLCGLPGKAGGATHHGIGLCGLPGNATDNMRRPDLASPANHAVYKVDP